MKIGIITFHRAHNYGAVLQAYALSKYVNDNINEAELIDFYPNNAIPLNTSLIHKIGHIGKQILIFPKSYRYYRKNRKFDEFFDLYKLSDQKYMGDIEIENAPPKYDLLISGSDQILNLTLSGNSKSYFLSFDNMTPKISYASSFGRVDITKMEKNLIKEELSKFRKLSTREIAGKEIIQSEIDKDVQIVVDPVFLLDDSDWSDLAIAPKEKEYIFVYAMENTEQLKVAINKIKEKYDYPIVVVRGDKFNDKFGGHVDQTCGPREFLGYIKNAKIIITNSFHGIAFSMIFKKHFFAIAHSARNDRIESLLEISRDRDAIINWNSDIQNIDQYLIKGNKSIQKLKGIISDSKRYLYNASLGRPYEKEAFFTSKHNRIDSVISSKKCVGCEACNQACPKNAIVMNPDDFGFMYPLINYSECVNCGICGMVCPILNIPKREKAINSYAARIRDETVLEKSTSGGIFTAISDFLLNKQGVVFGAVLDEHLICKHTKADCQMQRNRMRGAKYIQSKISGIYMQIEELLKSDTKVLFSGTPCQVAGLYNFLKYKKINMENLITVDIICHGVAAQKYFSDHIKYLENLYGKIVRYRFRSKDAGWRGYNIKVEFISGESLFNTKETNGYVNLYFSSLLMRESCSFCKYASIQRVADFTLGDFWGIEKFKSHLDDNRGVSCVFINSPKAKSIWENIKTSIEFEEYLVEDCMQPNLLRPTLLSPEIKKFREDYIKQGYDYCVKNYTEEYLRGRIKNKFRRGQRFLKKKIRI